MDELDKKKNWKVLEYVSNIEESSFDMVARDLEFRENGPVDIARYDADRHRFELYGVHKPGRLEETIDSLLDAGDLLNSNSFGYRSASKRTDNMTAGEEVELEGNYFFSSDADREEIIAELEEVVETSGLRKLSFKD